MTGEWKWEPTPNVHGCQQVEVFPEVTMECACIWPEMDPTSNTTPTGASTGINIACPKCRIHLVGSILVQWERLKIDPWIDPLYHPGQWLQETLNREIPWNIRVGHMAELLLEALERIGEQQEACMYRNEFRKRGLPV